VNSPVTRQIFFFGIAAAILLTITFLSTKDSQAMLTPWEVERGVKHSKIIVIGTVQSVETKLVDESFTISDGYHEQWLPYQYVTLKVEKYILDKTRQHSDTIIFRDRAEGEGILDRKTLYSNEDPVGRYEIRERSLFFITESKEELFSGGFQNKFDFVNEDKVQSKYFEMDEREPISFSKFEEEIAKAIIAFSPREQTASGFFPDDVRCKEGLQLIFKSKDNSPACVKPQTAEKLVERGWGTILPVEASRIKMSEPSTEKENEAFQSRFVDIEIFEFLSGNIWNDSGCHPSTGRFAPTCTKLEFRRDGEFRWITSSDYSISGSNTWNFMVIDSTSGLIYLNGTSPVHYEKVGNELIYGNEKYTPSDKIEYSIEELKN